MQRGLDAGTAGSGHQPSLQSLRGLAALLVVLHHCTFYYNYDTGLKKVAEIALNAHGAVVLFFVLSGYVLAKSLVKRPIGLPQVAEFYVRRVFRIYPALWLSVAVVGLYVFLFVDQPLPPRTSIWWWPEARRAVPDDLRHYILLFAGWDTIWALPLWTLKIEILGSILMPLVALAMLRAPRLLLLATMVGYAVLSFGPEISGTLLYLACFSLGAATLWLLPSLDRAVWRDWQWIVIGVAGLAMLLFSRNLFIADYRDNYFSRPPVMFEAIGAAMLIAMISVRPRLTRFLEGRSLTWLGDISYSLYLLHMPVIGLVTGFLDEWLQVTPVGGNMVVHTAVLTAIVLLISVPLSAVAYRYVELPGVSLGKRVHARAIGAVNGQKRHAVATAISD